MIEEKSFIIDLTEEEAKTLLQVCDSNIKLGIKCLNAAKFIEGDYEQKALVQNLLEQYKSIRKKLVAEGVMS